MNGGGDDRYLVYIGGLEKFPISEQNVTFLHNFFSSSYFTRLPIIVGNQDKQDSSTSVLFGLFLKENGGNLLFTFLFFSFTYFTNTSKDQDNINLLFSLMPLIYILT